MLGGAVNAMAALNKNRIISADFSGFCTFKKRKVCHVKYLSLLTYYGVPQIAVGSETITNNKIEQQ